MQLHHLPASQSYIITGSSDKMIMIWCDCIHHAYHYWAKCSGHETPVTALRWTKDNNFISGGSDGQIYYWRLQKYYTTPISNIHTDLCLKAHKAAITCLDTISLKKSCLVFSGATDGTIAISCFKRGKFYEFFKLIKQGKTRTGAITSLCTIKVSRKVNMFVGSTNAEIRVIQYDPHTRHCKRVSSLYEAHPGGTREIKYLGASKELMTWARTIRLKFGFLRNLR